MNGTARGVWLGISIDDNDSSSARSECVLGVLERPGREAGVQEPGSADLVGELLIVHESTIRGSLAAGLF